MTSPRQRAAALAVPLMLLPGLLAGCGAKHASSTTPPSPASGSIASADTAARTALAALEHDHRARLGLYAFDTGTGRTLAYRPDERFAHCSVFKALEGAVLLRRESDARLDRVIHFRKADLEAYSPITGKHADTAGHAGTGMTERQLIAAAMDYSDNTAANLLLDRLGGPHGLQSALRALGDATTHDDRPEPEVNEATPGDIRDTSTPRALGTDLRHFALGSTLPQERRKEYIDLLEKNTTGGPFIRAGVPQGWTVGDKTGNGYYGTRNDIAVLWPAHGDPIVLAILSDRATKNASSGDTLIADATRIVLKAMQR